MRHRLPTGRYLRYWIRRFSAPLARFRSRRVLRRGRVGDHQRSLARAAWWGADPRWFAGGTPPRAKNQVQPLVDGERYFSALHADLLAAQHYVYVAGWCFTPELPLLRGTAALLEETRLLAVLGEIAGRLPVRILIWSGSAILFQPTTAVATAAQETMLRVPGDLRYALDRCSQPTHTQHQKAIVIDGQIAYVGGMDLTSYQGDRWDTPAHPLRVGPNWHDVQLRLQGEAVADVEANFRQRWGAVDEEALPPQHQPRPEPSWQTPVQIVRTIPPRTYPFARNGEFGIHHAYLRALRGAQRLIYLENQYLWSPHVMDALIALIAAPPDPLFRIVLVLPAQAEDGKFDNDQHVAQLRDADGGRGLVEIYCPYTCGIGPGQRAFTYRPIYLHAKVAIIDDTWCTVGSANLNERGLLRDTELNAVVRDADVARALRLDLWSEHLGVPAAELAAGDPTTLIDERWTAQAATNLAIMRAGDRPLIGTLRRYEPGRMPGAWVIDEAQALTLEH
jgi:phosphatidylserine/phosphatidylglycerophosphate/cardiolipin synthase-like enzyme